MFEGLYTAVVTPFNSKGQVDYERLRTLIELQIAAGVDGIVPVGTTGESPTVDFDEHNEIIRVSVEACRKRVKVIAGTGANATKEALKLTRYAKEIGADGSLQVAPYYNRPNQEGLYRHFSEAADIGLPVVLYNIPGRCGVEIALDTVARLARHPNIVAIKEAAGNVPRVSLILAQCDICVLSGDDALTLPMMVGGARGAISVASNVAPAALSEMVHAALRGDWQQAVNLHRHYFRLFNDLFLDTNPIPVKTALAMMGLVEEVFRLPLVATAPAIKEKIASCLKYYQLIP